MRFMLGTTWPLILADQIIKLKCCHLNVLIRLKNTLSYVLEISCVTRFVAFYVIQHHLWTRYIGRNSFTNISDSDRYRLSIKAINKDMSWGCKRPWPSHAGRHALTRGWCCSWMLRLSKTTWRRKWKQRYRTWRKNRFRCPCALITAFLLTTPSSTTRNFDVQASVWRHLIAMSRQLKRKLKRIDLPFSTSAI